MNNNDFEVVSTKEFYTKMKIGRTSVFRWIKDGVLVEGEHFFRNKRTLLFLWNLDTVSSIFQNSSSLRKISLPDVDSCLIKTKSSKTPKINLEYGQQNKQ